MEPLIKICVVPPGGDPRAYGVKLKEIGRYLGMVAILAAAVGYYFYYFKGFGYISDLRWAGVLGISLALVIGQLIHLIALNKVLSIMLWFLVLISGHDINAGGLTDKELGVTLLAISGPMAVIALTMIMKGNILLKTYQ